MNANKRKGVPAAAFMATFSTAGRDITPAVPVIDNTPKFTVVERWNGQKFIEVRLEWDGTAYKEIQ